MKKNDDLSKKPTILIIDDDVINLTLMEDILKEVNFTILVAEDGISGLERALLTNPDLILLDVVMDEMDGYETCRRLKDMEETKNIPVIFMTALGTMEDKIKGFQVGAVDYITKPFQKEEVQARLGVHLRICELTKRLLEEKRLLKKRVEERTDELVKANRNLQEEVRAREKAQKSLFESERMYRTLIETTRDLVFIVNIRGIFTFVNPTFEAYAGYSFQEMIGKAFTDVIAPDRRRATIEQFKREKKSGTAPPYEVEIIHRTGGKTPVEFLTTTLWDSKGKPTGTFGVGRDVSERKQAAVALQAAFARRKDLEFIINNSAAVAWLWKADLGWPVEYVSDNLSIYGYEPSDFVEGGLWYAEMIYPDDLPRVAAEIDLFTRQGRNDFTQEYRFMTKDGECRWVEGRTWVRRDADGAATHYQGIVVDITARRQADAERKRLEKRLIHSQKIEAVGALAGGMAHDFNNILGGVMSCAELSLRETQELPRVSHSLAQIIKATERAKDLVQRLLIFSRKTDIEKKPVKMSLIVKEVNTLMRAYLPATIELSYRDMAVDDIVMADPTQMHQVLMNLYTNAGHAMRERGGVLEVLMEELFVTENDPVFRQGLSHGRYLALAVKDTGHGILPTDLDKIFDPYFTTKQKGEGTGLGLSVVHGIVKDHGGDVRVYSEAGRGTVFKIYLPLIVEQLPGLRECAKEEALDGPLPGGSESILFIDDESDLVENGKEYLEMLGYRVIGETDPLRALEVFKSDSMKFDMVITDKTMPGMTGFDMAKIVKEKRTDMPIILCTGYIGAGDLEKQAEFKINHLALKPVRMNVLANTVRKLLDERNAFSSPKAQR